MMRWKHSQVPLMALLLLVVCLPAQAKYSGGSGTAQDPYQIATAADLIALGEAYGDYDKHFILTADIDLNPSLPGRKVFDRAVIGLLTGVFDGNGHKISHLTIVGGGYLGLFGQLGRSYQIQPYGEPTCMVKNLTMEAVSVTGSNESVGALAGHIEWGIVSHSRSTGKVSGNDTVGGLVGYNGHSVINCHSGCTVTGTSDVGGLVGNNYGSMTDCYSTGAVSGGSEVGGLVGSHRGFITQSYSTGEVSGKYTVGGLVGRNGIVGRAPYPGNIHRSYSTATITGGTLVGGLIGDNRCGAVSQCYSASTVRGGAQVGGLVGDGWSMDVTASFWDVETSGLAISNGGEGRTTAQMQMADTFLRAGWDFIGEAAHGLHETWQMPEGGGYPILTAFTSYTPPQLRGQGTPQAPYLISDARELGAMIHYNPYAHYRLTASIDLSGVRWARAVIPHFAGTFDGGGHTISYLSMTGADPLGLFDGLDVTAEVRDLGIVDANVLGTGSNGVGGLSRYNWGTVTRCYITGAVSGIREIGGLVGRNSGAITCCYSRAVISGVTTIGGLVAYNGGDVAQCYSAGATSAQSYAGGLVGYNYGNVTDCFWDIDTSRQFTSAGGGIGKRTAEMQTAKTFLDAGWDFIGETANGAADIWWIDEGKDYPRLWWEARN